MKVTAIYPDASEATVHFYQTIWRHIPEDSSQWIIILDIKLWDWKAIIGKVNQDYIFNIAAWKMQNINQNTVLHTAQFPNAWLGNRCDISGA